MWPLYNYTMISVYSALLYFQCPLYGSKSNNLCLVMLSLECVSWRIEQRQTANNSERLWRISCKIQVMKWWLFTELSVFFFLQSTCKEVVSPSTYTIHFLTQSWNVLAYYESFFDFPIWPGSSSGVSYITTFNYSTLSYHDCDGA